MTSNGEGLIPLSPLPGRTIARPAAYRSRLRDLLDLVAEAVRIARTSSDDYLRHRVEIRVGTTEDDPA
ncbi:hypothetical protein [Amycolatopsis sp. WQ 127309]|uniref:hypothetical protein n=1 Tax=Amycolatopsis sp. WQ 127309 TaxID=2932773 RepID=UPI001FF58155|nr:hypothetical protein [Amycolatopsis sp. WQ 127309]UOZ04008.1 hypothetical protein MUY22_34875 [Amycolatopsis sp. WQ 127309]